MMAFNERISARLFGLLSDKTILGFKRCESACGLARYADIDSGHQFDPITLEAIRLWWEWDDTRVPLYLSGPTGCGKTSTVNQFLARVNAPAVTITCRRKMDKAELIGGYGIDPKTGHFRWFDGAASAAWRHGLTLVINEFTTAPAEVWIAANDILEGDNLTVERTGEVIVRHPNTRVIITDNARAAGSAPGQDYLSRNRQDASVADRFWHVTMNYMSEAEERLMLRKRCEGFGLKLTPSLRERILDEALQFAHHTRLPVECDGAEALPEISTRVLVRFSQLLLTLAESELPETIDKLQTALSYALSGAFDDVRATALLHAARFMFTVTL